MVELCFEAKAATPPCESSSQGARRRRMEIRKYKNENGVRISSPESGGSSTSGQKRKLEAFEVSDSDPKKKRIADGKAPENKESPFPSNLSLFSECPKYGVASVCGRRREMEDAVSVHPWFCRQNDNNVSFDEPMLHYFGVYDGHGCSHVKVSSFPKHFHFRLFS